MERAKNATVFVIAVCRFRYYLKLHISDVFRSYFWTSCFVAISRFCVANRTFFKSSLLCQFHCVQLLLFVGVRREQLVRIALYSFSHQEHINGFFCVVFSLSRVPCAISTMLRLDHTKILNLEAKRNRFFDGLTNDASWLFAHCSLFSSPLRARKNTPQLVKYLHALYVKPLNELYILTFWGPRVSFTSKYHGDTNVWFSLPFQCRWKENLSNWSS